MLGLTTAIGFSQTERLQFEVATIKPNKSGDPGAHVGTDGPRRFSSENASLQFLVQWAWSVREFQIVGGPKWFSSDRFDIQAVAEGDATFEQSRLMLRTLLEDRFRLKVHREKREQPVYILTQSKNGAKIQPLPPGGCVELDAITKPPAEGETPPKLCGSAGWGPSEVKGTGLTMANLATYLSDALERPVIDQTGLAGFYDIELIWTPDDSVAAAADLGPSIFTAIQEQLGLRLDASRTPAEVLVIDSAQPPTEN